MEEWERSVGSMSSLSAGRDSSGGRPRMLSVTSTTTNRTWRGSRVELVDMPGGAMLVEVEEEKGTLVERRNSLEGARTLGGVVAAPDTHLADKMIKQELAHHSPSVGAVKEGQKDSDGAKDDVEDEDESDDDEDQDPVLVFGATNLLQHLHLALATPALFRFPALAYKWSSADGSGFLVAYVVVLLLVAPPISILEQTMAQFSSLGPTTVFFRCLPILTGVGIGMVALCLVLMPYSSTVLAWALRYTFDCLQAEVPWATCHTSSNASGCPRNMTPNEHYFLRTILGAAVDDGVEVAENNVVVLGLALTQGLVWLAMVLVVWRGEAWRAGAVSRAWSLVTVAVLVVLIVYGLQQPSSGLGLGHIFVFSGSDLAKPDIWLDAFGQVVWTLGPCMGLLITRASYRHFRDRIRLDAYTAVAANLVVAMAVCLAIFPFLTHSVEKTPGFFLVESSWAIMNMEVPQLGGTLLYLSLCKALFDHTQMLASTVTVGMSDMLPGGWRSGMKFFFCCAAVCVFGFLSSLPFITHEGVFLVRAVDSYVPWASALLLAALEVAGLAYGYGAANIGHHFKLMLRSDLIVTVFVWRFLLLPVFLALGVWACVVGVEGPVTWHHLALSEEQEEAYQVAGVVVALLPAVLILLTTVLLLLNNTKNVHRLLVPREAWGPALVGHHAQYTPWIVRAKNRAPYLVVQVCGEMESDKDVKFPGKSWLPFGFFWVPPKSETQLVPTADMSTKTGLARYLQARFSKSYWDDEEDKRQVETEVSSVKPVAPLTRMDSQQEVTLHTVSAGVLLQPNNLSNAVTHPHC